MRLFVVGILSGMLFLQGICFASRDEGLEPAKYLFIPQGNAAEGKKAFIQLKCNSCHQTADHVSPTPPVAAKIGPTFGITQAEYPAGWIANSIISPSHTIAIDSDGQSEGGKLSRMPDFTDIMTVHQLIDIIAYIQAQGNSQS
ncbi:MAG: cytochrome c [Candidatus Omnitrophica bacterium]|nr:cytochrome c [Candidatus Omnitrophota bacterium]